MEALKQMGADGYIGSETYCSADIMSPQLYRNIIFNAQRDFYNAIGEIGLIPITYFLGNIVPLIDDIKKLGVKGLMIEESKKNFKLDVSFIYDKLERAVCLFGNLDSVYIMQKGAREDVICETTRQISACNKGAFVMSNGCPLSFFTPPENVSAMIETAKRASGFDK
jgi:uroporphyrinogen-III decarboxylase